MLNRWIYGMWIISIKTNTSQYQVPFLAGHLHPSSYLILLKQILFPLSISVNRRKELKWRPASKYGWGLEHRSKPMLTLTATCLAPHTTKRWHHERNPTVWAGYSKLMGITTTMKDKWKHKLMKLETRQRGIFIGRHGETPVTALNLGAVSKTFLKTPQQPSH